MVTPSQLKKRIFACLSELLHEAEGKTSEASLNCKDQINRRVMDGKRHYAGDWVYVDKLTVVQRSREKEGLKKQDLSVALRPKKVGPFKVISVTEHGVTIDIIDVRNVINIAQVTFARRIDEVKQTVAEISSGEAQIEQQLEERTSGKLELSNWIMSR